MKQVKTNETENQSPFKVGKKVAVLATKGDEFFGAGKVIKITKTHITVECLSSGLQRNFSAKTLKNRSGLKITPFLTRHRAIQKQAELKSQLQGYLMMKTAAVEAAKSLKDLQTIAGSVGFEP